MTLIGATTENPSFEVIAALLSRCRVYVLERLTEAELETIVRRALADPERGLGRLGLEVDPEAVAAIVGLSEGDARTALNILEVAARLLTADRRERGAAPRLTAESIREAAQRKALLYDKGGEEHYNLISALHKSVRDSDPDATLYWLARMLEAGEDRLFLARRLVRMASEDIGLADPQALQIALAAKDGVRLPRDARGRAGARRGRRLPRLRAEVERRLHGLRPGARGRPRPAGRAGAAPPPQRADAAHDGAGLRRRLPVRPRRSGRRRRAGAPARGAPRAHVLSPRAARVRAGDPRAPRALARRAPPPEGRGGPVTDPRPT